MNKIFFIFFICTVHFSFAQNPLVKSWDYRFGGTTADLLTCFDKSSDGGYFLGGFSGSGIGGDKTEAGWGTSIEDFWIVKVDSVGNKLWDRTLGGLDWEEMWCVEPTADGGCIAGGWSQSGPGGNKTNNTQGGQDYWIVKLDASGNQQWDKDLGGTSLESLQSVSQTSDGGYLLAGYSFSGIGGDKTEASRGDVDYWIVKTDSLGNKQWDKDFGGTGQDILFSVQQTSDGGYILGGHSGSPASGDKTEGTRGSGDIDFWLVKTDSLGNKLWDKVFGGTMNDQMQSLQQTADGGIILAGISYSDANGDKSEPNWSPGFGDYWMVKTDANGNKQWDKDFGGTGYEDQFGYVVQTADQGYLLSGTSYSSIGGNKTEGKLGVEQGWIVKTDSLGNFQWDKTVFTQAHDEYGFAVQTNDLCYAFANFTDAAIGGYKSQSPQGFADYWIVKFCETLHANFTSPMEMCPGTCCDFTNLSLQATSYQWSFPGANPSSSVDANPVNICYANPGTYDVQLIATNATGSDTLTMNNYITVYPSPLPQGITQQGDTLLAIPGAIAYRWYYNGQIISGATNYFYVAQASGDYNVIATDANGCEVEAAIFSVTAGLSTDQSVNEMILFPDPADDALTISGVLLSIAIQQSGATMVKITIYNMMGEVIQFIHAPVNKKQEAAIDVAALPKGMYMLELGDAENILRGRFVKK